MKILLEELPHQLEALQALDEAFYGLDERTTDPDKDYVYANPIIKGRGNENTNIDIKMETGTGKTYVGARAMYDLHQKYGLFKFIVVVPSPAIKEGWKNFIEADYAKQHFSQYYENTQITLNVINAGDFNPSFPDYYNVVLKKPVPTAFPHKPCYKSLQLFITRFNR